LAPGSSESHPHCYSGFREPSSTPDYLRAEAPTRQDSGRSKRDLRRFIYDKFPVSAVQSSPTIEEEGRRVYEDEEGEEGEEGEDVRLVYEDEEEREGNDDEQAPNADTLSNLGDFVSIICTDEPYIEACSSLKRVVFPTASDLIDKVLRRHLSFESPVQVVRCRIEWQVLEYLALEATKVVDLGSKFTLNGNLDAACASRPEDYICQVWNTGPETFDTVKSSIETLLAKTESSNQG
jgi:hypothetical protein